MKTAPTDRASREAYIQRHLAYNLTIFLIDGAGYWLGISFFSAETILPYFVKELGGSDLLVGLIPAIFSLGFFLPQLFVAPFIERRPLQRRAVMKIAWLERLPFGLMAPLTYLLAGPVPGLLLALFFVAIAFNAFTMGANTPAFSTMLTKAIPADKRGRLWGVSMALGGLIGIAGARWSSWLLEEYGMPQGYALCFLIGYVVLMITVTPLGWVREPEGLPSDTPVDFRAYWSETCELLRQNPGFRTLVWTEWFFALAAMAPAFYTAHAHDVFGAKATDIGHFTMIQIAAVTVGGYLWGVLSDRRGTRRTLVLTASLMGLAPLMALFIPSLGWYPLVFFFSALARTGFDVGYYNIVLEYAGEQKVATFQGVRGIAIVLPRVVFPLMGGVLAERFGYAAVFGISLAAVAGILVMLKRVRDPRFHRTKVEPLEPAGPGEKSYGP